MEIIKRFFDSLRLHFYDMLLWLGVLLFIACALWGKALGFLIGFFLLVMVLLLRKAHFIYTIAAFLVTEMERNKKPS